MSIRSGILPRRCEQCEHSEARRFPEPSGPLIIVCTLPSSRWHNRVGDAQKCQHFLRHHGAEDFQ